MSTKNDIPSLRAEFARLSAEVEAVLDTAKSQDRDLTDAERKDADAKFSRMQAINLDIKRADIAKAREAFESNAPNVVLPQYPDASQDFDAAPPFHQVNRSSPNRPLLPSEKFASVIGTRDCGIGIGSFCRAMVLGPRTQAEKFAVQQSGDNTGAFTLPQPLAASVIDYTRSNSAFVRAGALTVPLIRYNDRGMRLSDNADPTWRAEDASVTADMSFSGATIAPKSIAVIVKVAREVLDDAINADDAINDAFATAFGAALDAACGWGASNGPSGIFATSNIQSVTSAANGDTLTDYSKLLSALYELQLKSTQPNAYLLAPRDAQTINGFTDSTGQPLRRPDALQSLQQIVVADAPVDQTQGTANNASTILMGDMSKLSIFVRDELRIEVLREKYADNLQYAFLATLRVDAQVTRPKAFCKVTGIIP
jgi:HK97 family phage major capsid protein